MDKRKRFSRTCAVCGRIELVRSDQLKMKCKPCQTLLSAKNLIEHNKDNPESYGNASRKHGMYKTRLYRIHKSMMERCGHMGTRHKWAMYYQDRGITVCKEWHKKTVFFEWALRNNYSDKLELDRIDNHKGYLPENCRWVTHLENMRNRRKSTTTPSFSSSFPTISSPIF